MAWEPEPGWLSVPGGSGPSTVGVWRTQLGGQPLAVKRLARPVPGDPPELSDPTHFAYWRREADVAESGAGPVDTRPARTGDRRRGGRRGHHADLRLGRGGGHQRAVRRPRARPVRRRRPRRPPVARARPAPPADHAGGAPRRVAHPRPYQRRRPRRQPLVTPRALPPASTTPSRSSRTTATWPRRTCAVARATWSWPSTGRASGSGRSAPTSVCTWPAPARPPNPSSTPT